MIKKLIKHYGKEKINTLTKYPSILTLHKLGEKGKLTNEFTTSIDKDSMYATEKIDGINVRIIVFNGEFLVGSREFILHHSDDLYFDPSQGIVDYITNNIPIYPTNVLTVIYGELYGGKTTANSKWYGKEKNGFRAFDVAIFRDLSILDESLAGISNWRERESPDGMIYGQEYLTREDAVFHFPHFEFVPVVPFELGDMTHRTILDNLKIALPETNVALTDTAIKKAEGLVFRNNNRSKIVKIRYEDYEKVFR
jgi:hypothetical protein